MTYATTATTSCVSYGSSLALSLPLLLLLLSTPLSHLGLITAPHSTLASLLGCIERVIRTAARLTGGIPRTGHVSAYMLDVLHWLPLQQRIMFRIGAMVWRCILGLAPAYLRDLCHPTPGTRGCSSLRSSEQGLLFVPFARTS